MIKLDFVHPSHHASVRSFVIPVGDDGAADADCILRVKDDFEALCDAKSDLILEVSRFSELIKTYDRTAKADFLAVSSVGLLKAYVEEVYKTYRASKGVIEWAIYLSKGDAMIPILIENSDSSEIARIALSPVRDVRLFSVKSPFGERHVAYSISRAYEKSSMRIDRLVEPARLMRSDGLEDYFMAEAMLAALDDAGARFDAVDIPTFERIVSQLRDEDMRRVCGGLALLDSGAAHTEYPAGFVGLCRALFERHALSSLRRTSARDETRGVGL